MRGLARGRLWRPGAVIPEHTVMPPGSLVAGVPGKVKRTLGAEDLKLIRMYAKNYVDYTKVYLAEAGIL